MTCFVIDVESDGPNTHLHSMHWFGVVRLDQSLDCSFEGRMAPISSLWDPKALAVSRVTREEILTWPAPTLVMPAFADWIREHTVPGTRPQFWSDNNGYDHKWLSIYSDRFGDPTLMGHSSRNINDRLKGFIAGAKCAGKPIPRRYHRLANLRVTKHDHNPVNDARANAEALLALHSIGYPVQVV